MFKGNISQIQGRKDKDLHVQEEKSRNKKGKFHENEELVDELTS